MSAFNLLNYPIYSLFPKKWIPALFELNMFAVIVRYADHCERESNKGTFSINNKNQMHLKVTISGLLFKFLGRYNHGLDHRKEPMRGNICR